MRALICGDIHGNLPALELMLKTENANYDSFYCHGDVINYGPWNDECIDLLLTIPNAVLLKGNHEEYFLKVNYPGSNPTVKLFFNHCIHSFTRFSAIAKFTNNAFCGDYYIVHTLNDSYIFSDTRIQLNHAVIVGHSHYQFINYRNNFPIINTGSVGQNRKYINEINYLIYDDETNSMQLKSLIYNHHILINELIARKYPQACIDYYRSKMVLSV
jgi:predicted phosphodiesterase